ncbi:SAM-dependent methyltransferase [Nocardia brasiliensis]|uniref:SAM-dependent methyltransferase n=1 Tax=Nocardia brasiliensis TaxID=37326 RepID=UPI002453CD1E|nr:SAM-dependent methyltransferase [Nocardia brasiliensis]
MTDDKFEAREIDPQRPSAARMYHYYVTGSAIFDADRILGEQVYEQFPYAHTWALHNRAFLARATRFMVGEGIRQFLDIGSGLPTGGNTHEVARAIAEDTRVVYVDNDLEAVSRAHDLLLRQDALSTTAIVEADLRNPEQIFAHPETRRLIDPDQPVGLLLVSVLPFLSDASRPNDVLTRLRNLVPAGSFVAMTHVSLEDATAELQIRLANAAALYQQASDPVTLRNRNQFAAYFDGFELVDPGITYAPDWRPDQPPNPDDPARVCNFAAIGYKP